MNIEIEFLSAPFRIAELYRKHSTVAKRRWHEKNIFAAHFHKYWTSSLNTWQYLKTWHHFKTVCCHSNDIKHTSISTGLYHIKTAWPISYSLSPELVISNASL